MQNAGEMEFPLDVEMGISKNWLEAR